MSKKRIYTPTDKMSDIICDNYRLLQVMSRFDIPLGFGDASVEEVCQTNQVDCNTFLAVVNFINKGHSRSSLPYVDLSVQALMHYLKNAHHYFLDFQLPTIRRKLLEAIDCSTDNEVTFLILKFFDGYVQELKKHMNYEDMYVFTYVENLQKGIKDENYNIDMFVRNHNHIDDKLTELKNIIIKYYPAESNIQLLNEVLMDIYMMEEDMFSHCRLEDQLFAESVHRLEDEVRLKATDSNEEDAIPVAAQKADGADGLSEREKEVIVEVVKGYSNKEIAENMFISVNTVMTHRRNITKKLNIHSPAGLTIYAIVNGLVRLEDIKL